MPTPADRKAWFQPIEAAALLIVLLVAMELASRIDDWVRFGTPVLNRAGSVSDLMVLDRDGMHGLPGSQYGKYRMNNLGLRGPDVSPSRAPRTLRILVLGSSETFGSLESLGREYPRQLEDTLRARGACGPEGTTIEVLNAGLAGQSLPTARQHYELRLRRLQPQLVVVLPNPSQYLQNAPPGATLPDSSGPPTTLPLANVIQPRIVPRVREALKASMPSALLALLRGRATHAQELEMERQRSAHSANWTFDALPRERMEQFERDLIALLQRLIADGVQPVVLLPVNRFGSQAPASEAEREQLVGWNRFFPRATQPVVLEFTSRAQRAAAQVSAALGVPAVDLDAVMGNDRSAMFTDAVHFTERGAAAVAGAAASVILETPPCRRARAAP